MKTREPVLYLAVGKKGIGKTTETVKLIDSYVKGSENIKPRRVLIMDVNNEFTQYKTINPNDVIKFSVHPKIEVRRISIMKPDGSPMSLDEMATTSFNAIKSFRNGLFLMEDITKYVSDSLQKDIVGTLATSRHIDTDIIAHFQFIGKIGNPKIKSTMNILRFHKCGDNVVTHKTKFPEYVEILSITETLVNRSYNYGMSIFKSTKDERIQTEAFDKYCRFFCYVDFDKDLIKGNFSPQDFRNAVTEYIQMNPQTTVERTLMIKDRHTGKAVYTYQQALEQTEKDLFQKYYGN